jgi:biopolymer transport protein ExbD
VKRALLICVMAMACRRSPDIVREDPAAQPKKPEPVKVDEFPVSMPKSAGDLEQSTILAVQIDKHGAVSLNRSAMSDDAAIDAYVRKELSRDPEVRAIIEADRSAPYGRVIELIDTLKKAGVTKYSLAVAVP